MDQQKIQDSELKLSKAMMQLMRTRDNSFTVNVLLNLPREASDKVESMEMDGITLLYKPDFVMEQSDEALKFDIAHIAWHVVFFDKIRSAGKEAEQWNEACDHYNNLLMKQNEAKSGIKVPDSAAADKRFSGKEKDDIYKVLLQEMQSNQQQPNDDPMKGDMQGDGKSESDDGDGDGDGDQQGQGQSKGKPSQQEQDAKTQREMESIVQQAAMQAKMAGNGVPAHIQDFLEELYNPKLPWNVILAKYMDSFAQDDYSYAKINKKFFPHGIILPSMFSEGLGKIAIANDESCSVSDKEFECYIGAIKDIKDRMNPESIEVVNFTTQITNTYTIDQEEDISKIKFRGRGGTHIPVVFDHFNAMQHKPQVLIVFSDMESQMPQQQPDYDVIWICVNNKRAGQYLPKWGKKIYIEV